MQAPKVFSKCLPFLALVLALLEQAGFGELLSPQEPEITLTGILLVADHHCAKTHSSDDLCRSSDWALASGRKTYLLFGDIPTLEKFERKRVSVRGRFEEESMIEYGVHVVRRKITAHNIESSELSEPVIENLIERLKAVPWRGPENNWSPMFWDFHFTDPMVQILEAGPRAQDVLLCHIGDQKIQDQVIMLLGGIGDEHAIGPIIDTLTDGNLSMDPRSRRLNVIGDLALTNLTVSEVIWFHGGGPPHNYCPDSPKSCWTKWWLEHKASFKVGVEGDRLYVNYPNYGIYQQFGDTSRP